MIISDCCAVIVRAISDVRDAEKQTKPEHRLQGVVLFRSPVFPLHPTASLTPSFVAVGDVRSQQPGSGDLQGGEYYDFQAPFP